MATGDNVSLADKGIVSHVGDVTVYDLIAMAREAGLFTGVVLDTSEGERIAAALGNSKAAILQNHGLLTVGKSVDEAAWWFVTMERSCQAQLLAEAAGNKGIDLLVHLTGTGVLLIRNDRFEHLCRRCRVSVCHESAQTHDLLPLLRARHPELLASCNQLAGAFLACGRRLVF